MKKTISSYIIISSLLIVVDTLGLWFANGVVNPMEVGPFQFGMFYDESWLFPILHGVKPIIQTSCLFGLNFFIFAICCLLCMFFAKNKELHLSLALVMGGVLSQNTGILILKKTAHWMSFLGVSFSLSSIAILIGLLLFLVLCVKNRSAYFQKYNVRKTLIIMQDQYVFCSLLIGSYCVLLLSIGVFFYIYLKNVLNGINSINESLYVELSAYFVFFYTVLSMFYLLIVFIFIIYLSNRIYGPVYAFKKYVNSLLTGKKLDHDFKLREGDHFRDLMDLAKDLNMGYKNRQ